MLLHEEIPITAAAVQSSLENHNNSSRMLSMMKNCKLTPELICEEFEGLLQPERILNVYVYGSRLYGKSADNDYYPINQDSDFDIMLVYDFDNFQAPQKLTFLSNQKENRNSEFFQLEIPLWMKRRESLIENSVENSNNASENLNKIEKFTPHMERQTLENGEIIYNFKQKQFGVDMCIYTREQFLNQLKKHQFSELLGLFLERSDEDYHSFILKKKVDFSEEFEKSGVGIQLSKLRASLSQSASMVWKCCRSMMEHRLDLEPPEVEVFKGKKTLIHTLRVYHYGIQIAKFGKIVDWHECDKYYDAIFKHPEKYNSFRELSQQFNKIRLALHDEFRNLCPKDETLAENDEE